MPVALVYDEHVQLSALTFVFAFSLITLRFFDLDIFFLFSFSWASDSSLLSNPADHGQDRKRFCICPIGKLFLSLTHILHTSTG